MVLWFLLTGPLQDGNHTTLFSNISVHCNIAKVQRQVTVHSANICQNPIKCSFLAVNPFGGMTAKRGRSDKFRETEMPKLSAGTDPPAEVWGLRL